MSALVDEASVAYAVYEAGGEFPGRILRVGQCRADQASLQATAENERVAVGQGERGQDETHYVRNRQVVPFRGFELPDALSINADGKDGPTLGPLPEGTKVSFDGGPIRMEAGRTLAIRSDMPGSYELRFSCWPFADHVLTVTAHAAS